MYLLLRGANPTKWGCKVFTAAFFLLSKNSFCIRRDKGGTLHFNAPLEVTEGSFRVKFLTIQMFNEFL